MVVEPFEEAAARGRRHEPPPKPKRFWWRFPLGLGADRRRLRRRRPRPASCSTSTASPTRSPHNDVLQNKVERFLAKTNGGEPQNILILGSDKRASEPGRPGPLRHDDPAAPRPRPERDRADVDPARPQGRNPRLRDRQVQRRLCLRRAEADPAGGQGTDRAADQPRRQRRLPRLRPGRRRDRLRLRRRRPPLLPLQRRRAASEQYAEINVQPGYQLLCGKKALQYVRYRHTDTDLVRSARQQDFLSDARQRVPVAGPRLRPATS